MAKDLISNLIYLSLPLSCFAALLVTIVFIVQYMKGERNIDIDPMFVQEIQIGEPRKAPVIVHAVEKITISTKRLKRTPDKV